MARQYREYSKQLLQWWVNAIQHRALTVLIFTIVSSYAVLYYSLTHFKINVDMGGMISNKLHFRKLDSDFSKALPSLTDTIVVVIDADTAERAVWVRKGLAELLKQQKELFKSVYEPGGDFFRKKWPSLVGYQ